MFQRFHQLREEREGGFTLIELLVVILIIAILAAIAIPVFLEQRKKGWASQAEATLKNAATAQESFAAGAGNGAYTTDTTKLQSEGFRFADEEITFAIVRSTEVDGATPGYCMTAVSQNDGNIKFYYDSTVGAPKETTGTRNCTSPGVPATP